MDFLSSTSPQGRVIFGQPVSRARFGNHIRLGELQVKIDEAITAKQSKVAAALMDEYFGLAGFEPGALTGEQCLVAYYHLVELNTLKGLLAFQVWPGPAAAEPLPYNYEGRMWAWWVHKLASRYGWTRHYIFDELYPEEAAAYLQEILISEYDEADERRSLSEIGWRYDKTTKQSRFIPLPRPGWMVDRPTPVRRVRKSLLPVGNVIRLDDLDPGVFH